MAFTTKRNKDGSISVVYVDDTEEKLTDGDFAPVRDDNGGVTIVRTPRTSNTGTSQTTEKDEDDDKKWYQKIFQKSGAFDDGYQFGDVLKTVGGSVGDLGVNVLKGAGRLVEGVTDLAGHGIAGVADWIGQDEWAENFRDEVNQSVVDRAAAPVDKFLDDYSVFGELGDSVGEALGQVAAIILTGGAASAAGASASGVTAATTGLVGASSVGSGISEAYLKRSDEHLLIPMPGDIDSLNVSVATGVICFEVVRQRMG